MTKRHLLTSMVLGGAVLLWLARCTPTGTADDNDVVSGPGVSGVITTVSGAPVAGASVVPSGIAGSVQTNASGRFSLAVPAGWSGTVSPQKAGLVFSPVAPAFTNVTAPVERNFTAIDSLRTAAQTGTEQISLKVLAPNGSEVFTVGQTILLQFGTDDSLRCLFENMVPEFNNGIDGRWIPLGPDGTATNVYEWTIPDTVYKERNMQMEKVPTVSEKCRIRLMCYDEAENVDASDGVFTILPRP